MRFPIGAVVASIAMGAAASSGGLAEHVAIDLLTALPVLWGMLRWAKAEKKRRDEEWRKAEAERQRREALYRLLDPIDGPNIAERMEKAEADNEKIMKNQDQMSEKLNDIESKIDKPGGMVRT